MSQKLIVGISDWKIGKAPDQLVTYALGSCIGTCLYDKRTGIAGLSHIMLPNSADMATATDSRMKFADTALPDMLNKMLSMGATKSSITAKIIGGALMFQAASDKFNIGERNVIAVKNALAKLGIPIIASDTGLNYGRTVTFFAEDGSVEVSAASVGKKMI